MPEKYPHFSPEEIAKVEDSVEYIPCPTCNQQSYIIKNSLSGGEIQEIGKEKTGIAEFLSKLDEWLTDFRKWQLKESIKFREKHIAEGSGSEITQAELYVLQVQLEQFDARIYNKYKKLKDEG
jgi:hypothetical protein